MKICDNCGAQMPDEALCCTNCGTPLAASQVPNHPDQQQNDQKQADPQPTQQQPNPQPNSQPVNYQQVPYQQGGNPDVNNKAIAALALGVGGLVLIFLAPFLANFPAFIGLVVCIIGIVLGVKARNELPVGHPNRGMATGGMVCGIIGTVIGSIATVCTVCVCSCAACMAGGAANTDWSFLSEYSDYFTILFR